MIGFIRIVVLLGILIGMFFLFNPIDNVSQGGEPNHIEPSQDRNGQEQFIGLFAEQN